MFKDKDKTEIPASTYTLKSNLYFYGYDTQNAWSIGLTLAFSVVQAVICGFSWNLFNDQYYWITELRMRQRIVKDDDEYVPSDVNPDVSPNFSTGADGIKCYRDNLDEYGNECLFRS